MKKITVNENPNYHFAILGDEINPLELDSKLDKTSMEQPESFWGTLGWSDDSTFKFQNEILISRAGNTESKGATGKIVNELKLFNPLINDENPLIERVINFEHCKLEETDSKDGSGKKQLRMTIYLKPDEGALAYIQHSLQDDFDDPEAEIEFILPNKTNAEHSTDRNRLDYVFDFIPQEKSFQERAFNFFRQLNPDKKTESSFIVKILTFSRGKGKAMDLFRSSLEKINKASVFDFGEDLIYNYVGEKKYALLKFNPQNSDAGNKDGQIGGRFEKIDDLSSIDPTKRILLLIHGTFSNTLNTFRDILASDENQPSLLQELQKNYDYILAFDHPTITANASDNVNYLLEHYFENYSFGDQHIDVMACSRGCIVAELLANSPAAADKLKVGKVMLFSAANGVGYFQKGAYVPKFLSVWRKTANGPFLKVILSAAQYSTEFFLQMPGCEQMTPNHPSLTSILSQNLNSDQTVFYCAVSDWNFGISRGSIFKRSGAFLLDRTISFFLGHEHDWVVGCTSQRITPDGNANRIADKQLGSMHTKYLDNDYTKSNPQVHQAILDFFKP